MPHTAPAAARTALPRAIIFLNPQALDLVDQWSPGQVNSGQGPVGHVSLRNEPVEAFNHLAARLDAQTVCTVEGQPYDTRDSALMRGIRTAWADDWLTDQSYPVRADGIFAWWKAHGRPLAVVIDRPGVKVPGIAAIHIPVHAQLTMGAADRALAILLPSNR